jgi:pimeloyl-ACP methyl ester carboxylesterase
VATFVLIHGAGDVGWYWHLVAAELRRRGHDVVAPDLPCDDDSAGLSEYADTVLDAIGDRRELVVVAQSFGAFTAPLPCTRVPVERGEWSGDENATFYHDVPSELAAEALKRGRRQSDTPTQEPWPLEAWPDVPTRFLLCRDDRLLPAEFLRRVVRERLGIEPDEIDAGHCVALSRPVELAARLGAYRHLPLR